MARKFYFLLFKDNKEIGILHAPKGTDTKFGSDIMPVIGYEQMAFELKNGSYAPMMASDVRPSFVNKDLKELFETFIPKDFPLEFLPIEVKSDIYGNQVYYMLHFTRVFDVINLKHSKIIPETGSITVPCIDSEKVQNLDVFNSSAFSNGVIVSDKVKRMMKKKKLDYGLEFWEWKSV